MDRLSIPNYTQIPSRLPLRWWQLIRGAGIVVALGLTRAITAPAWLKEYGYVIAFSLFIGFVVLRRSASTTAARCARCCCWAR